MRCATERGVHGGYNVISPTTFVSRAISQGRTLRPAGKPSELENDHRWGVRRPSPDLITVARRSCQRAKRRIFHSRKTNVAGGVSTGMDGKSVFEDLL